MTVSHVGVSSQVAQAQQRRSDHWDRPDRRINVGQVLELQVVRRLGERRYLVSFAGEEHVVETAMQLTAGRTVRTTVVAVGEKLELKYVGAPDAPESHDDPGTEDAGGGDVLTDLETKHAIALNDAQRAAIANAMSSATQPELIASGGLYLSKLSLPVGVESLSALHDAQTWTAQMDTAQSTAAMLAANADLGDHKSLEPLAAALRRIFENQTAAPEDSAQLDVAAIAPYLQELSAAMGDRSEMDAKQDRSGGDLARQLLNEQDGGSLAYHYGVLPVLIADQLVELDVVYFRERQRSERSSNTRRLVMTFKTQRLGRIEIEAQAVADRLSVQIASDSSQSSTTLAAHVGEVKDLLARLGWDVDAVNYEFEPKPLRAAERVIAHVLNSETLDRMV